MKNAVNLLGTKAIQEDIMPYGIKDVFGFCAATTLALAMLTPAHGAQEETTDPYTVDNIPAGETFIHKGPVVVKGDVGEGASVIVSSGGLHVRGNVRKGAGLWTGSGLNNAGGTPEKHSSTSLSFSVSVNGTKIASGRTHHEVVTRGGEVVGKNEAGLVVDGVVEDNAKLRSTTFVKAGEINACVKVEAAETIQAERAYRNARLSARNGVKIGEYIGSPGDPCP